MFSLAGKVAVITGSTKGIGKSIAEAMAEAGARVVISSRKIDSCIKVANSINERYGQGTATPIAASISSKDDLKNLIDQTNSELNSIDVLVCNAATCPYFGPMGSIEDNVFRKILDNNILSNHWLVNFVAPHMIKKKDGAIIIVSSIGGMRGSPVIGAYNISKAADFQLARNLAVELGVHNIRVNCIAPGLIKTDFSRALWENPQTLSMTESATPLRRIGDPEEVAGAAVFLASNAGRYVTGQKIVVDGGLTIDWRT